GAGNLQQEITPKEDSHPEAEFGRREVQSACHLKRGIANVHAVKVCDYVQKKEIRKDAAPDALPRSNMDRTLNFAAACFALASDLLFLCCAWGRSLLAMFVSL